MGAMGWEFSSFSIGEYGLPGPERDRLVAAIVAGDKTATASLLAQYGPEDRLPKAGDGEVVVDSSGRPMAVIRTTSVDRVALSAITEEFVRAEGEGLTSVAQWRDVHLEFWASLGHHPEPADVVIAQRFELVARLG